MNKPPHPATNELAVADAMFIAPLTELQQFERCIELQIEVWGYSESDLIPRRVFIVARQIGGQVLGAFDGSALVGFAMSLPGFRDGKPYLHSHMLAVRESYRNLGLGRRLKLAQRADALTRGIDRIEWTFDPLEIKNSHLNIARLGAIARRYLPDFYGPSSSPLQGGLPTDRLVAEWWLRSARVERTLSGRSEALTPLKSATEQIEVPNAVYDWKKDPAQRGRAEALQINNRVSLQAAFARGLAITGYERTPEDGGLFLLEPIRRIEKQEPTAAIDSSSKG